MGNNRKIQCLKTLWLLFVKIDTDHNDMYCCSKSSLSLTHSPGSSQAPAIRLSAPPPVCLSVSPPSPGVVEPLPIDRHGRLLLVLSVCVKTRKASFFKSLDSHRVMFGHFLAAAFRAHRWWWKRSSHCGPFEALVNKARQLCATY